MTRESDAGTTFVFPRRRSLESSQLPITARSPNSRIRLSRPNDYGRLALKAPLLNALVVAQAFNDLHSPSAAHRVGTH